MTTIAYRNGVMASESGCVGDGARVGATKKVFKLASGALYGSCGDADDRSLRKLLDKAKRGSQLPTAERLKKVVGDIQAILVLPCGEVWDVQTGNDCGALPLAADFHAVGSGHRFALGAMAAGATAEKAVAIACEYDVNSKGPIQVMKLARR